MGSSFFVEEVVDLCFIRTVVFEDYVDPNNLWGKEIKIDRLKDTEARSSAGRKTMKTFEMIPILNSVIIGKPPTGEHFEVLQGLTGSELRFILQFQEPRVFAPWLTPRLKWSATIAPYGPVSR